MSSIRFTYYGIPTGKGRARISTRGGFARAYTPKKTQEAEQNLQAQAAQYRPDKLIEGVVSVAMEIYVPIPASWSAKKKSQAIIHQVKPTTKPDMDNIVKLVFDAFNGIIWVDDKQVCELTVSKFYSNTPRIEFNIQET